MATTLTEVFTEIADAIRSKTGTTQAIPVNDMAARITSINSGGSDVITSEMQTIINNINTLIGV